MHKNKMRISILKELKLEEHRVALPPAGVRELVRHGHKVYVETQAGVDSGFTDQHYTNAGGYVVHSAEEAWRRADVVLKVKEPQPQEFGYLRDDLILFTYLHLAAEEQLTRALLASGVTALAYETVEDRHGRLPLLEPMSEVAGKMASQIVAHYLEKHEGGRGILMGGVPGVAPAHIVVLGGGTVGTNAAKVALGMGAHVTLLDVDLERLRYLADVMPGNFVTLYSNAGNIAQVIQSADAVIGSVLIAGARAPMLITRDMLPTMPDGSVIVDVAVDQGGCVETTRPTTHRDPTYVVDGVLHYGVSNMPGAVPRTSAIALANATLSYVLKLADKGLEDAIRSDPGFAKGLNTHRGQLIYQAVGDAFGIQAVSLDDVFQEKLLS